MFWVLLSEHDNQGGHDDKHDADYDDDQCDDDNGEEAEVLKEDLTLLSI